jgi:hypothetical protein
LRRRELSVPDRFEEMLVAPLVPDRPIEPFDIRVLRRLATLTELHGVIAPDTELWIKRLQQPLQSTSPSFRNIKTIKSNECRLRAQKRNCK